MSMSLRGTLILLVSEAEGFPGGTVVKNLSVMAGDTRNEAMIPGSGRSSGAGNGNLLQYSWLGNPMDRGACWATVHEVTEQVDMS